MRGSLASSPATRSSPATPRSVANLHLGLGGPGGELGSCQGQGSLVPSDEPWASGKDGKGMETKLLIFNLSGGLWMKKNGVNVLNEDLVQANH